VTEGYREKTSKTLGFCASTIGEQRYESEPTETKYFKFCMLIVLGSGGRRKNVKGEMDLNWANLKA